MTTKISADNLKADIAITTTGDIDVSSGTLTLANDQISGDKISGGTISTFASTGIDDNATSTAITIDSSQNVGIKNTVPSSFNAAANQLVVGIGSGNQGMTIYAGTTAFSGIHFADGTTGNETYRGILRYQHNTDHMEVYTAAVERMRIDSSGNVGINTSSPQDKIDVRTAVRGIRIKSTGNTGYTQGGILIEGHETSSSPGVRGQGIYLFNHGNDLNWYMGTAYQGGGRFIIGSLSDTSFQDSTNELANSRLVINTSGNVGIGTSSPSAKLDVRGSNMLLRNDSGDTDLKVQGSSGRTIIISSQPVNPDTTLPNMYTGGAAGKSLFINSGNGANDVVKLNANNSTGFLLFEINNSEKMRINSSGNVGIGTTSPDNLLMVSSDGASASAQPLSIVNAARYGTNDSVELEFGMGRFNDGNNLNFPIIGLQKEQQWQGTSTTVDASVIFKSVSNQTASERMRIDSSGDVLVATTTNGSKAKLHVEGSIGIGADRFDTHEIGKGASGTFTTITTTFTTLSGASVIVEALMTGYNGVYLDHVIGKYSSQGNVVMRNNASSGTTVTLTLSSNVYTHTITTSVVHPVVKYKITAGALGTLTVAPTITFA